MRPDGRLDLHAIDYQHIRSTFDVDGADTTIGFPLARLIAVSETLIDMSCTSATVSVMPKAVQFDSYGGVDVLEVRDVPCPVPEAGEVLVEVRAAGINPSEAVIRNGAFAEQFPATFPSGQGSDLAGVGAELGSGVSGFAVGDEVIGFSMRPSSHAEY